MPDERPHHRPRSPLRFGVGLYWSFETDRRPGRLLDAYPPATLRRLRELKYRYDPTTCSATTS